MTSWAGLTSCGPRSIAGGPDVLVTFPGGTYAENEFECVELSKRWMYLEYGIPDNYLSDGAYVVSNYPGSRLTKVSNDGAHGLPTAGDILSSTLGGPHGHTQVVTGVQVNSSGNGTVSVIEQNNSSSGTNQISVNGSVLGMSVTGWLHDPNGGVTARTSPGNIRTFGKIDFNRDGVSDFVIYSGGGWYVRSGAAPYPAIAQGVQLGGPGDIPLLCDVNGDGVPDFVIYSGGDWVVRSGVAPYPVIAQGVLLGGPGDIPLVGDFNGDGGCDFAIYSGGQWAVRDGKAPYPVIAQGIMLGSPTDIPLVGDFNGDGVSDFAIYSGGDWVVRSGVAPYPIMAQGVMWGGASDIPGTG
jgi:hypothetical protein